MEEVNVTSSLPVSAKRAAKLINRFVKHRPEANKEDGLFVMNNDEDVQAAGNLQEERLVQLSYVVERIRESQP